MIPKTLPAGLAAHITALVGAVLAAEHCPWGFAHETWRVMLASGTEIIVQLRAPGSAARTRIELDPALPLRLATHGVRMPRVLAYAPPILIREYLPGFSANTLLDGDDLLALAAQMGALTRQLALVDPGGLPLDTTWATPETLVAASAGHLTAVSWLEADLLNWLERWIGVIPQLFGDRPAVFSHGDFCPVNLLCANAQVIAMIDVEYARLADRLFDAAWWAATVQYHHPVIWDRCASVFLAAAGADTPQDLPRMICLQIVGTLARLADTQISGMRAHWLGRLRAVLARYPHAPSAYILG